RHFGIEAAVDARAQAANQDTMAFFTGERTVIHVGGRADGARDGGADLDLLGLLDVVVGLLFGNLGQAADNEDARVADAVLADKASIVVAERHLLTYGNGELGQRRWRRVRLFCL